MKKTSTEWIKYSGLGIQMAVSVILCLYIGKWIGSKFDFLSENVGSLMGIFFGLFASIYHLFKELKN